MRAVVQRVSRAAVTVDGAAVAEIGRGFVVLVGVGVGDTPATAEHLATKVVGLRLFEDDDGRMNRALDDVEGAILSVSQFTLYGDVRRGRRPSFVEAAPPDAALPLYEAFCRAVEDRGVSCRRGAFGKHMALELCNDGPVTLLLDSADLERPRRA